MTHDPDTLRATLWVILAVMIGWSIASVALVALVQRFLSTSTRNHESQLGLET
jgi:predicted permease